MSTTSTNLSLVRWTSINDTFNHTELANNFAAIDTHDHTGAPSKGLQIPTAGLANLAVTSSKLADLSVATGKIANSAVTSAKIGAAQVTPEKLAILPVARVHNAGAQSIPSATNTTLSFTSERFDTNAIHDNVTNPSRLTCNTNGYYHIVASVAFQANATGIRRASLLLNGVTEIAAHDSPTIGVAYDTVVNLSTIYQLTVGQYITVRVWQDSGAALNATVVPNVAPEASLAFISP